MDSRSLIKTKNSMGARMGPCVTPDVTLAVSGCAPSSATSFCLAFRNDLIYFSLLPLTP